MDLHNAFSDKILQLQGFHSLECYKNSAMKAIHITKMVPSQTPKQYKGLCFDILSPEASRRQSFPKLRTDLGQV